MPFIVKLLDPANNNFAYLCERWDDKQTPYRTHATEYDTRSDAMDALLAAHTHGWPNFDIITVRQ